MNKVQYLNATENITANVDRRLFQHGADEEKGAQNQPAHNKSNQ